VKEEKNMRSTAEALDEERSTDVLCGSVPALLGNPMGVDPQWQFINPAQPQLGVQYVMQGQTTFCYSVNYSMPFVSVISLECAVKQGAVKVQQSYDCTWNFLLPTPLACAPATQEQSEEQDTDDEEELVSTLPTDAANCAWAGYNLSTLSGTDYTGTDGSTLYKYYLSVCSPLTGTMAGCSGTDASSAVCQEQVEGKSQTFDLANWSAKDSKTGSL
jgi:hypothetical protein